MRSFRIIATAAIMIAASLRSIALSLAFIASKDSLSEEDKAAIKATTADLKETHDRLQAAIALNTLKEK